MGKGGRNKNKNSHKVAALTGKKSAPPAEGSMDKKDGVKEAFLTVAGIGLLAATPPLIIRFFWAGLNLELRTNYQLKFEEGIDFFAVHLLNFNTATIVAAAIFVIVIALFSFLFFYVRGTPAKSVVWAKPIFELFIFILLVIGGCIAARAAGTSYGEIMKEDSFDKNPMVCDNRADNGDCDRELFRRENEEICVVRYDTNKRYKDSVCFEKGEYSIIEVHNGE